LNTENLTFLFLKEFVYLFFQIKFEQRMEFPGLVMKFLPVERKFLMVETIREGK